MSLRLFRASTLFALTTLLLAPACGGGGGGDQTTKFVGTWTFSSGELTPTCSFISTPFMLTGISVMFAKIDDSTISLVIGTACTVKFKVSGGKGTVEPKQTCTLAVGALGPQAVAIDTWTLALSGDRIDNTIAGSISICQASGTAVLTRGAPDGGTHDGGTHEGGTSADAHDGAGGDGSIDTTPDSSPTDASPEATPSDAAPDVGADDGADAPVGGSHDAPVDDFTSNLG